MTLASWHDFYYSAWQEPFALWLAPFAFAVWRVLAPPPGAGVVPGARSFVVLWTWLFLVETVVDPVATGPLAKALGNERASTALGLTFVLLGDFRIWWLVFAVARPAGAARRALLPTAGVPIVAWLGTQAAGPLPGQVLWLVHETLFLAVAFFYSRRLVGRFEREVLAYAGVYYALWAGSDALILAGVDAGWLLRCVPNQLYYGFTVPFVAWRFFASSYSAASQSTQTPR